MFNHLIPEVSKLPKYMGELFSSVLTEGQFSALKGVALKNNVITQGMLSWGSVNSEINSGTPPAVAIGTEAAMLASNAAIGLVYAGVVYGLSLTGGPAVIGGIAIGFAASLGLEALGLRGAASNLIGSALGNLGMLGQETGQSANSNVMFLQSSLASASSDLEPADELVVSGYQFYRALKEILDHPEKYPSAEEHIGDIVSAIGTHFLAEEVDQTEQSENAVNDRPLPETILFSALETLEGLKSFVAEGDGSFLFIGDEDANEMIGGDGFNWFMPLSDPSLDNKVIGGKEGYNVLDFSLNQQGIDIFISGNDRIDEWIDQRAADAGVDKLTNFLFRDNALTALRGKYVFEELDAPSLSFMSAEKYKNIDYIIGSAFDDIIIGDLLGGMTISGGSGNDTIVVHGGGNRIVFRDEDFTTPGSGEGITTKYIHGLTTEDEAYYFNGRNYIPESMGTGGTGGFRIDPDVLDFSNLDGDLNQEGHQQIVFIGVDVFSGTPGELRYVTETVGERFEIPIIVDNGWQSSTVRLEGDRTGDGEADFFIEYTAYNNPSIGSPYPADQNREPGFINWEIGEGNLFF
ncbi:hypothetical protein A5892_03380 [Halotalea alkalilenta]|uniref:Uncharacterized protein n=1 Tax=Halotalea alkalilenta TaxID=376489 RepID=A0A172YC92_9GAMM|nr:hypothetical protein A5892_03380 [Halotalea alkalilenta]